MMDETQKDDSWLDITEDFMSSIKQLNLGELLKFDQFTLLEAMSAIELMNPKMDSGMLLKKSNRKILTLEQSVRMGLVKTNQLELNELIGIIDETYSFLATWLEGNLLSQTVMTNLYLHEPERIEDRCLRVFSQSTLKLVDFLDKLVQLVYCIEEEDFLPNHGKFNLANHISEQKVLTSLEDLCQHYEKLLADKQVTSTQNNSNDNKKQQPDQQLDHNQPEYDKSQLIAIVDRLRFTYNFYASFLIIYRFLLKDYLDLNPQTEPQLLKTAKVIQSSILICDQHLEKCLKYLDKWKDTIHLGIEPKPSTDCDDDSSSSGIFHDLTAMDYPSIMGFDPLINHKLLPPAYPRCPPVKSRSLTVDYMKDLITRLRQCLSLATQFNQKSFSKSLEVIEFYSKYSRPSSCVISRSLILALYLPNRSVKLFKDELLQSMNEFCEPLVQSMKRVEAGSIILDKFLTESCAAFSQVVNIYGQNAARQHEKFPDIIISFKNLQCSALLIDSPSEHGFIYSWVTYNLTKLSIKYIQAGLELELFSAHEYPYVFWYLYDILYSSEREHLELAKHLICQSQIADDIQKKTKGKKQRKKNLYNTNFQDNNLRSNDAFRFLTGGLFLLTYGLKMQGKIKTPLMDFTNEEICFDHRFCTLTGKQVYKSYKQTLERLDKLDYIYREALECFSEAKEIFQTLAQHEDCLKVCKTNLVVAKILASNLDSFTGRVLEFSFETHPSFPTVKV